ncbi:MAG: JAB domain-containing protein [Ktedonobacteraceae bacterium]|nr:JAB domain-containing protein [Ktedonobacteraceae bacterium]
MLLRDPHPHLTNTASIFRLLSDIASARQEHVVTLSFDPDYRLIQQRTVSIGSLTAAIIHPREVFAGPLQDRAFGVIVAHNHPSGHVSPSQADIAITMQLIGAGELLGIPLYDHIIVAGKRYLSLLRYARHTLDASS